MQYTIKINETLDMLIPLKQFAMDRGDYITIPIGEEVEFLQPFKESYLIRYKEYYGLINLELAKDIIEEYELGVDEIALLSNIINKYKTF